MMEIVKKVRIYTVNPSGFKPTYIQVIEINSKEFYCRFLDIITINEFKTMGFKVNYLNGDENYSIESGLDIVYAERIWSEYLKNKDNPDIEF